MWLHTVAFKQKINRYFQLVNGTNYFIKVKTGDNEAVHVRVWKGFQDADLSALQLHSIKQGKALSDPIEYF